MLSIVLMFATLAVATTTTMPSDAPPDFDRLWDYPDPAGTERKFRELLPRAQASGGHSYHAQLLTQIARTQGLQRRFDEAHATLDEVERMLDEHDDPLARVRYLLERGRVIRSSQHSDKARSLFERAFKLGKSHRLDFFTVDAAHMLALVEPDPADQINWNRIALELAERSADERIHGWRGALYNNIGWTYFDQKQYDEALAVFERAVAFREEAGKPRELRLARYAVAKTLRMKGTIEPAMSVVLQLVEEADAAGEPDGYFLEELAECLLASGKADAAKPWFARAHAELSKDPWLAQNEPQRLKRLLERSR